MPETATKPKPADGFTRDTKAATPQPDASQAEAPPEAETEKPAAGVKSGEEPKAETVVEEPITAEERQDAQAAITLHAVTQLVESAQKLVDHQTVKPHRLYQVIYGPMTGMQNSQFVRAASPQSAAAEVRRAILRARSGATFFEVAEVTSCHGEIAL